MSDRILVMREGNIVAEYSRDEATQEIIVGAMMSDTNHAARTANSQNHEGQANQESTLETHKA
jgi:ABC-type sugar transport system ATPase subunit